MIKEFIWAYKEAYNKINEDKIKAKDCINHIKKLKEIDTNIYKLCLTTKKNISDIYKYLPKKQRQDYVQKTLDLLQYGNDFSHDLKVLGVIGLYKNVIDILDENLKNMKMFYKDKEYKIVASIYKDLIETVNNEFKILETE
jgi:hypothetical protein